MTSLEAGNANQKVPDQQVPAFAVSQNRAVVTLNRRDFIRLHKSGISHAGIIVCTADADYPAQALRIQRALGESASLAGQLLRVNKTPAD